MRANGEMAGPDEQQVPQPTVELSYPLLESRPLRLAAEQGAASPSCLHWTLDRQPTSIPAAAGRSTRQDRELGIAMAAASASASATASLSAAAAAAALRPRQQRRLCALARAPAPPPRPRRLSRLSPRAASSSPLWEARVRADSDAHAPGAGAGGDVMGLLLRERIVFLGNEIEDFLADAVVSQLLLLDAVDPDSDIRLFVNSPGGSLSATMAIYDVMQLVRADVSTVGLGIAGSTASIILGGGTKGKRFAMPNTRIMIHQPVGGASGQALDVEVQAKEILTNKRNVIRLISGFTGRTPDQVEKDIDRDRYMGPLEAVDYGLIDGVIDGDSIIPLEPVPERVKPKYNYEELYKDPHKFLTPDVPDDEIY
ncbi:hypothetical protein ABZP36_011336 [Zizania latifolia]